jgi:hypothetical protein
VKTTVKTTSEILFEDFCKRRNILCNKIPESISATPDYRINYKGNELIVEIKEIDLKKGHCEIDGIQITGTELRYCLESSRKQMQYSKELNLPSIAIVYFEMVDFSDFIDTMKTTFNKNKNTSFSAVGKLINRPPDHEIQLFTNYYARNKINVQIFGEIFTICILNPKKDKKERIAEAGPTMQ